MSSRLLRILSCLAAAGLFMGGTGLLLGTDWLVILGLGLGAPLVLGGLVSLLLAPYALWEVAREKRDAEGTNDMGGEKRHGEGSGTPPVDRGAGP